ncbi:ABC transporter ATP-binding protein [Actinospica durhamensis]|uniref:ABC transporter ATP-binding protein n=1 Tax=Actinospica durhamensis TaxID=1508375 RepID=A0A941EZ24_9ACTN|nr:ABC transporter ATP-binding protein [Actinospica durhamensis]MBR7836704.1 ABC transporter ATP-binding protein [Actinospica durhamensis]
MPNEWVGPVVALRDLTRAYGNGEAEVRALVGINLEVAAGELVAVMGPSGSGKTTLLSLAGGLDAPTSGNVVVEGVHLSELSRRALARLRRTSIGYVFQDYNLIPALTAGENVALPLELDGMRAARARKLAERALEEVGLGGLGRRFPEEMSGGQRQRTAIARALIGERRLVLADEPTGALDSQTSEAVLQVLRARCDAGAAGILVTHEPRYAAYADRTVYLRDGKVVGEIGGAGEPEPKAAQAPAAAAAAGVAHGEAAGER